MFVRPFNGMFAYFLQTLGSPAWEAIIKYDFYDPNRLASGNSIGSNGTFLNEGDIKYETLGIGLTRYMGENIKALIYYDFVRNESTSLPDYLSDLEDDVLTVRVQVRF
jgi:hypothetical protein